MDKKFCIATLTHSAKGRIEYLVDTIDSFCENTNYVKLDWFILINGYTEEWEPVISSIKEKHININFYFYKNDRNEGVGAGINRLNQLVEDYQYVLFLEGDWICLPESITGVYSKWLEDCIEYLDTNKDIDVIHLRAWTDDIESRQYGYKDWIRPENIKSVDTLNSIEIIKLQKKGYTNNPALRRNKRFYEIGIFPLPEFYDDENNPQELKGKKHWGQAELQVERLGDKLKSTYLGFGKFIHGDHWRYKTNWDLALKNQSGCSYHNYRCKYGFIFPRKGYCGPCRKTKNFSDLSEHDEYFVRTVLPEVTSKKVLTKEELDSIFKRHGYELTTEVLKNNETSKHILW